MTTASTTSLPSQPASSVSKRKRVPFLIVGGGISGLSLGFWMNKFGVSAHVIDKKARTGGVIKSAVCGDFRFERGPNTILDKSEAFNELLSGLDLDSKAIRVPLKSQGRYIWHAGRMNPVPMGPGSLISTKLFSLKGKLRVLMEPWIASNQNDETLKDFIERRLGQEIYERAFLPMVQGIGAGDPSEISATAAFPLLKDLERDYGNLVFGFMKKMKADRKETGAKRKPTNLVSFPEGLVELPNTLASNLGDRFHLEHNLSKLQEALYANE